jgi:hypothetical protein
MMSARCGPASRGTAFPSCGEKHRTGYDPQYGDRPDQANRDHDRHTDACAHLHSLCVAEPGEKGSHIFRRPNVIDRRSIYFLAESSNPTSQAY